MLNLFTIHKTPFMFKIQSSLNEHINTNINYLKYYYNVDLEGNTSNN